MKNKFAKGILHGLFYYAGGFLLAWIVYLIFGWEYIHAPGLHHLIGFLFLVGGIVFLLRDFILLITGDRKKVNAGFLLINIITLASIVIYILLESLSTNAAEYKANPGDIITINKNDSLGNSSIIDGNGDTLYLRNADTILIDKFSNDSLQKKK